MEKTCRSCKYSCANTAINAVFCMRQKNMPRVMPCETCKDWKSKKQTNADKIRQMSDEELAELISAACPPYYKDSRCVRFYQKGTGCKGCWLDWLKQEVESDE